MYHGYTNGQFVTWLCQRVLGRAPSQSGLAAWTAALGAGVPREQMVLGFTESAEYIAKTRNQVNVWLAFAVTRGRCASGSECATWLAYLNAGNTVESMIDQLL